MDLKRKNVKPLVAVAKETEKRNFSPPAKTGKQARLASANRATTAQGSRQTQRAQKQ